MKSVYDVIIRPVITEQSMEDLDIKKFVFEVAKDATRSRSRRLWRRSSASPSSR